jgi:hypothetical protein
LALIWYKAIDPHDETIALSPRQKTRHFIDCLFLEMQTTEMAVVDVPMTPSYHNRHIRCLKESCHVQIREVVTSKHLHENMHVNEREEKGEGKGQAGVFEGRKICTHMHIRTRTHLMFLLCCPQCRFAAGGTRSPSSLKATVDWIQV